MVKVELVYVASDGSNVQMNLDLPSGTTVGEALEQSGIYSLHAEARELPVGIYARQVSLDRVLKEGDRIELYRPLLRDPKEKRRQLAKAKK